jgi:hypothetical protein
MAFPTHFSEILSYRNNFPSLISLIPGWSEGGICFHCNCALFDCDKNDIPFIEHARYFPYCPYIRFVKGHAFIRDQHPEYRTDLDQFLYTVTVTGMQSINNSCCSLTVGCSISERQQRAAATPATGGGGNDNGQRQHQQQAAATMAVGGGNYGNGQRQRVLFCSKLPTLLILNIHIHNILILATVVHLPRN